MNVASLELCKELYELGGWGDYPDRTHFSWRQFEGKTTGSLYYSYAEDYDFDHSRRDPFDGRTPTGITHHIDVVAPAYDLGHLLRKLPERYMTGGWLLRCNGGTWVIRYGNNGPWASAATPENATAKLAIVLFKQGILKAGDGGAV